MAFFGLIGKKMSLLSSDVLKGMSDRHSHILYGVDDGVKTLEEALDILKYEEAAGIKEVWCTPHVMEDVPNTTETLKARFGQLKSIYDGPIVLNLAAEYMLDNLFEERLEAHDLLTMEDDIVLVEASTIAAPYDFKGTLGRIMSEGYRPLLAHPERYRYLTEKDYEVFMEMGISFQLNLASLTGYYGESTARKAEWILKKGWYMAIGSDCHRFRSIKEQFERQAIGSPIKVLLNEINAKG
jgi:tyrosine-protein phosphatase YwqE